MVYTSYYSKAKKLPSNVRAVPISITAPGSMHGVSEELYCLAVPETTLWRYKSGRIKKEELFQEYKEKLDRKEGEVLSLVKRLSKYADVCFLCWEKDPEECHRSVLSAWLNEHGVKVKEWGE